VAYWLGIGSPVRSTEFDSPHPLQFSMGEFSLRASEPVSCWPHKPCEWRSTRQPATNFWGSRSTGGPLACNQPTTTEEHSRPYPRISRPVRLRPGQRVRLPPLPPSSPGRPLRSRRQSEELDKHVRLVLLAPSVAVAEWLRRATVNRSTRVQFSPVTPFVCRKVTGRSVNGKPRVFEARLECSTHSLPARPG
jgi:hypothetical protein